jgi:hypothetical protein
MGHSEAFRKHAEECRQNARIALMPTPERRGKGSRTDGCGVLSWSKRPLLRPKAR